MSTSIESKIERAHLNAEYMNKLSAADRNELYALYKQATCGDLSFDRPELLKAEGNARWMAWKSFAGIQPERAKELFIKTYNKLATQYGFDQL